MTVREHVLGIIGAGAKAAAIAAKAKVLRDLGHRAPFVTIFERSEVGANWNGRNGFTTGRQRLGTPPEKDLGFPYNVDSQDPEITKRLFAEFSWHSYEIFHSGRYSEWLDRGRPHPEHREWSKYLKWALNKSDVSYVYGEVCRISTDGLRWSVVSSEETITAVDSLVVTGPGRARSLQCAVPSDDMIMQGDEFWMKRELLSTLESGDSDFAPIVIVGGGETSASIVNYLIKTVDSRIPILVLTRGGAIFTRGEGYYENRMFTDVQTWMSLPAAVRAEVIRRGDRGVFSVDVIKSISDARNVDHRFCEIKKIEKVGRQRFRINDSIDCQMIIMALGFDPEWIVGSLDTEISSILPNPLREGISGDLSIKFDCQVPKLHVPMLAGFAQGPGFPNLSCLGTLSDRILGRLPATR